MGALPHPVRHGGTPGASGWAGAVCRFLRSQYAVSSRRITSPRNAVMALVGLALSDGVLSGLDLDGAVEADGLDVLLDLTWAHHLDQFPGSSHVDYEDND